MNESQKSFSAEDPSTSHAASDRFTGSTEQELIAVLRSFRDLIDTVLWRVGDDYPDRPQPDSPRANTESEESIAPTGFSSPEGTSASPSEQETSAEQASVPPALHDPDEFLRAIEFLVRRGARDWQTGPLPSSGPAAERLPDSESTSASFA
jgi:hypothetical protein